MDDRTKGFLKFAAAPTAILAIFAAIIVGQQPPDGEIVKHWTEPEAAELRKVVSAGVEFAVAQENLSWLIPSFPKATTLPIMDTSWKAMDDIRVALSGAFSSESSSNLPRADEVKNLRAAVRSAETKRVKLVGLVTALNVDALPNNLKTRKTSALAAYGRIKLSTFDNTLPFPNPNPLSYPAIIGRHGHWEHGQGAMEHYVQYVDHTHLDGVQFWQRTGLGATENVKKFFSLGADLQRMNFMAWGLTAEIVLAREDGEIRKDQADASGSRGYGFFQEMKVLEYLYADTREPRVWPVPPGVPYKWKQGARTYLFQFSDAFTGMVQEVAAASPTELKDQFTGRRGGLGNIQPTGWASEFYFDLTDLWNSLDAYAHSSTGFFFALPGPPCGVGTHPVNGVCVPDAPPEPPQN